jgi:hypothetical protein
LLHSRLSYTTCILITLFIYLFIYCFALNWRGPII